MDYSYFIELLSTDAPVNLLLDLLVLNGRAILLLLCCFLILRTIKASAATRHLLASLALFCLALLPLSSRLIPALEIMVEAPVSGTGGTAVVDSLLVVSGENTQGDRFTADLLYPTCLAIYLFGFVFILARVTLSNLKLFLLARRCPPVTQPNWLKVTEKQRGKLGIRRRIDLRCSGVNASPSTWGAFRPVILLPPRALHWPNHLIQSTVLHELAHIKRYDWLIQQLARCICAVYWLNPFCWIAARRIGIDAETACDDMAINCGVRSTRYAKSLVDVAKQALQDKLHEPATLTMAPRGKRSQLSERILAILNRRTKRSSLTKAQTALILFTFACLLPLASLRAEFVEEPAVQASMANGGGMPVSAMDASNPSLTDGAGDITPGATDPTTAIPVKMTFTDKTAERHELSVAEKLSRLKQLLQSNRSPPVKYTTAKAEPAVVEPPKEVLNSYFEQQLVFNRSAFDQRVVLNTRMLGPSRKNLIIPEYPRRAQSRGIEGEVVVKYDIDRHGHVVKAQILSADPSDIFDREVLKAIKESTFNPRKVNGSPVPAKGLTETYVFVLKS